MKPELSGGCDVFGAACDGLLDFAVTNAGSTNAQAFASAFDNCMNGLQIQVPATFRDVVGVADAMTELRSTTAYFTNFGHFKRLRPNCKRAQTLTLAG
jgi:hypothetical protein